MEQAAHDAGGEQRGGLQKRRRMDAAEHAVRVSSEMLQQEHLAMIQAAAAAAAAARGPASHEHLLRLPLARAAQAGGAQHQQIEGQQLLQSAVGLGDLDRVQIDIASLDSRLMSQVLLEVLTPWQAASFLTESFPYLADRHGLADLARADLKFKQSLGQ